ncbi:MAG: ABC transporter ATP-binding protein [Planctomycetota bacterium]|nr:MAG: ABC transporter ATP-binding protein [Planctomycetota bacterium]
MIELEALETRAAAFRLGPLTLRVEPGRYLAVLGPSGSGKTLLLETLAGLHPVTAGRLRLEGQDATRLAPQARRTGYVPQHAALFPHLDVASNIGFAPRMAGLRGPALERRIRQAAAACGIEDRLHARPAVLSGGERQRVALARAIAAGPALLLLDEPLSALDAPARTALRDTLRSVHRELGCCTVHVTHDIDEAAALADAIAVLHEGRLLQFDTPAAVLRAPAHPTVATLCGARNLLPGRRVSPGPPPVLETEGGLRITAAEGPAAPRLAIVAPHDIVLAREPVPGSAANRIRARVARLEHRPPVCYVTLDTGAEPLVAVVLERSAGALELAPGATVHASFKASAVHLL